ncbi:universal stress protein UspE [Vibrio gazogenes]|uniref:Universal stress protein E n=1 Tax=Vibrio gazogenes DSM 21264 = NBRC 103151 TaxID=1123492 RepID=A0A1M4ZJK3_VIBGA|nr:universal stress protein UspE [Vibrio gazogenes]USP15198.1 universal stress protein UspE [Vibrio gazogenes]SHF18145.1 universal stress protein E [Vibrio gazogenes DSM 21264] [Vibrio gazogenes DSM 21264 = NBRC 103151]SJN54124.1 Universal stress protein E [Vibrio gazogenes]
MSIYNNILVIADVNHDEQSALARAMLLAKKNEEISHITLFLSIYDFSYDMTSMLSADEREAMRRGVIHQREAWLKSVAKPYIDDSIDFTVKVVWYHRPYEAIIAEVFSGQYDILIKATRKHDFLESVIFTPTDWHLMRKCPVPVLLVKNTEWQKESNVMASVHVGSENEVHHSLNVKLTEQLLSIADHLDATPYLVSSYPVTPSNITLELPEFDITAYRDAVRSHCLTSMKELRQSFGIDDEQTIVEEGLPEDIIPKQAKQLNVAMVIIGTTGRTGLSSIFIGNTAEHVIDKIDCDVLAIKPEGYVSPLDPNQSS